jgi:hypothetical protein
MPLDNLIEVVFTEEEEAKINSAIKVINEVLEDKVVNLTPIERCKYSRVNNRTINWIEKIDTYMEQKPELIPFYLDKEKFDKDKTAFLKFMSLNNRLLSLQETVKDTSILLGKDVYNSAISFYQNIRVISEQNVPGITHIYEDLSQQFPGRNKKTDKE